MPITPPEIDAICDLVNDLCGIYLDDSKAYLIESRFQNLIRQTDSKDYSELVRKVKRSADTSLKKAVVDAITTNETLFFRDNTPFDALKHKVIPEIIDSKADGHFPKRIRVWCSACSTGQEPYSIAMTLTELIPQIHDWDVQILASDISDAALDKASRGWYPAHDVDRGLDPIRLDKFFRKDNTGWRIRDEIRSLVVFEHRNLMKPIGMTSRFDLVFCRNVAIYFEPDVRKDLFRRIAETLTPTGYLFVGSQESLGELGSNFRPHSHCRATYYRPNLTELPAGSIR